MSIAPVSSFPPDRSEPSANPNAGSGLSEASPASGPVQRATPPVSGSLPKQESSVTKNVPSADELSQDVVEVHQDPAIKSQVIIQYLDKAKNVVLQVPSNQELGVERGIVQEFQQAAKLRANDNPPAAGNEGERTHGD
jgi:hypothetical protein